MVNGDVGLCECLCMGQQTILWKERKRMKREKGKERMKDSTKSWLFSSFLPVLCVWCDKILQLNPPHDSVVDRPFNCSATDETKHPVLPRHHLHATNGLEATSVPYDRLQPKIVIKPLSNQLSAVSFLRWHHCPIHRPAWFMNHDTTPLSLVKGSLVPNGWRQHWRDKWCRLWKLWT